MKRVIVVGSQGQDGRLICERLSAEGSSIMGIGHDRVSGAEALGFNTVEIADRDQIAQIVREWRPDEVYFLAAHHHSSQEELSDPVSLYERSEMVHVRGLLHFLEAIRTFSRTTRLFYAASSLVFGEVSDGLQTERTALAPRCIYGITKTEGVLCCRHYRGTYGLHVSVGYLYNHESPYRSPKFVSQKIVCSSVLIHRGQQQKLTLGNLSARVDWGYAPDFVDAMIRIVQLPAGDDFIIATGESHSVAEFVEIAFSGLGLDWRQFVEEQQSVLQRPALPRIGDAGKLRSLTGWKPSVSFSKMIDILLKAALAQPGEPSSPIRQ